MVLCLSSETVADPDFVPGSVRLVVEQQEDSLRFEGLEEGVVLDFGEGGEGRGGQSEGVVE